MTLKGKIAYYNNEEALAFSDVYLKPVYSNIKSRFSDEIDTSTEIANGAPKLRIPIISAGMDTVTEDEMAIQVALLGGLGEIHRNNTPEVQTLLVKKVKEKMKLIEKSPSIMAENTLVSEALTVLGKIGRTYTLIFSGDTFTGRISGIVTKRDFLAAGTKTKLKDIMTPANGGQVEQLIVGEEKMSLAKAAELMKERRIEKLPILDKNGNFVGVYALKDFLRLNDYPKASLDMNGRLMVGAAIGVHEMDVERALMLVEAGVDILFLDIAHGHSIHAAQMMKKLKIQEKIKLPIILGNVATKEGVKFALTTGADGIKVGIGPGYVCKTRNVAGTGVPQVTAVMEAREVLGKVRKAPPIISDGGIREPGDLAKAIAAGADTIMIGSILAGTEKSPGDMVKINGVLQKRIRGMASLGVLEDRKKLGDTSTNITVYAPEGRETFTPYLGSTKEFLMEYVGGLRSGMSYAGAHTIKELQKAKLIHVSSHGGNEQSRALG